MARVRNRLLVMAFGLLWVLEMMPQAARAQPASAVTLDSAKLRARMPKGWLSAKPHAYLSHELLWFHPQGARIALAAVQRDTADTMDAWISRIRESARARKITLEKPASLKVAGAEAIGITGRTRTHEVRFVVFFHLDRVVLIQFSCELKNRSVCPFDGDFAQTLASFEPL